MTTPTTTPSWTLDGSTSRTLIILAVIAATFALSWHGTVDGQATVGIFLAILGGAIHASGTRQGSTAAGDPPAADGA